MTIADRIRAQVLPNSEPAQAVELGRIAEELDAKAQELRDACERTIGIYDHAMSVAASIGKV